MANKTLVSTEFRVHHNRHSKCLIAAAAVAYEEAIHHQIDRVRDEAEEEVSGSLSCGYEMSHIRSVCGGRVTTTATTNTTFGCVELDVNYTP